jgi:hypothetical protein
MAYADIPAHMRPALTDLISNGCGLGVGGAGFNGGAAALAASLSAANLSAAGGGSGWAEGGAASGLEAVRQAVAQALESLKLMEETSDSGDRQSALDSIIQKLTDAEQAASAALHDAASAAGGGYAYSGAAAAATAAAQAAAAGIARRRSAAGQDNAVVDAAADELCSHLEALARRVVGLEVLVAQKDAQLSAVAAAKTALEERLTGGWCGWWCFCGPAHTHQFCVLRCLSLFLIRRRRGSCPAAAHLRLRVHLGAPRGRR